MYVCMNFSIKMEIKYITNICNYVIETKINQLKINKKKILLKRI